MRSVWACYALDEERKDILDKMRQILDFALFTIEFAKKDIFPKYLETIRRVGVINTGAIGTVDPEGALNLYDGKIRLMKADGGMTEFDAQDYTDYLGENALQMRSLQRVQPETTSSIWLRLIKSI